MPSQTQDTIRIAGSVGPGNEEEFTHEVGSDATIEEVDVRIYAGAELDLRVQPFLEYGPEGERDRLPLITYAGDKTFVDGEGDDWEFPISEPIEEDEVFGLVVENVNADYTYDFAADFVLERAGGTARLFGVVDDVMGVLR